MHRTEGPDFVVNGGKRQYQDDLALGTVLNSDAANAIQEEIAQAVEASLQTLAATGAADEAAGFRQLRSAIGEVDIASPYATKHVVCKARAMDVADAELSETDVDIYYMRHSMRRLITIFIPAFVANWAGTCEYIEIAGDGAGAALLSDLRFANGGAIPFLTDAAGLYKLISASSGTKYRITELDGSGIPGTTFNASAQHLTFFSST